MESKGCHPKIHIRLRLTFLDNSRYLICLHLAINEQKLLSNGSVSYSKTLSNTQLPVLQTLYIICYDKSMCHYVLLNFHKNITFPDVVTFSDGCPACWTRCQLTCKGRNTKGESGIVNVSIFWISAVCRALYMLSEPHWSTTHRLFVLSDSLNSLSDQILGQVMNDNESSKIEATDAQ